MGYAFTPPHTPPTLQRLLVCFFPPSGHIFPVGFKSEVLHTSSVDPLGKLVLYTSEVLGEGEEGTYWPKPTFRVTAADRPSEPIVADKPCGCWDVVRRSEPRWRSRSHFNAKCRSVRVRVCGAHMHHCPVHRA